MQHFNRTKSLRILRTGHSPARANVQTCASGFPFSPIETVEISGVYKKRRYPRLEENGTHGFMGFELKEYPGLRFNVSSYLPDEAPVTVPLDLTDSPLFLTVNKSDYDLLMVNKPAFFLKKSIRTYEVRTEHQLLMKKDLSLLE